MNDKVKVNVHITRRNLLLLSKVIERGLRLKDADDQSVNILEVISKESVQELDAVSQELLDKAGLNEVNEKLRSFGN